MNESEVPMGCLHRKGNAGRVKKDLSGKMVGRWEVLSHAGFNRFRCAVYLCRCKCGTMRNISYAALSVESTHSCGCLKLEIQSALKATHGHTRNRARPRTYRIWAAMRARCLNNHERNHRYSGRGITICDRWESFENFLSDMGEAPPGLTLDRRENDKGYSKDNCRWATNKVQQNNRGNNRRVEFKGRQMTLGEVSVETGIKYGTLFWRLKNGRPLDELVAQRRAA